MAPEHSAHDGAATNKSSFAQLLTGVVAQIKSWLSMELVVNVLAGTKSLVAFVIPTHPSTSYLASPPRLALREEQSDVLGVFMIPFFLSRERSTLGFLTDGIYDLSNKYVGSLLWEKVPT